MGTSAAGWVYTTDCRAMTQAVSPSLHRPSAIITPPTRVAINLHEWNDGDQDPLAPSIQPIGSFEIEDLTSNDGAFVQYWKPREPYRLNGNSSETRNALTGTIDELGVCTVVYDE
jgi:hypothetical protein